MVTLQELREQFPVRDCPPYGPCLVVPGYEFDPDWEAQLDVDVIETDFGDPAFTLIPLKGEKPTGIPAVPEKQPESSAKTPQKPKRKYRKGSWNLKDEERLLKRWDEVKGTTMERAKLLAPEFADRKPEAIYQKHWALTTDYTQNRRKTSQKPTEPSVRRVEKKPTVSKNVSCPKCGLPLDLCACVQVDREQERIKKFRKKIEAKLPITQVISPESKLGLKTKETQDIAPALHFKGRNIIIDSNGLASGTHVYVDGKVVEFLVELTIHAKIGELTTVQMKVYDF